MQNFPEKYQKIWEAALPFLQKGRPGDDTHALNVAKQILEYNGELKCDKDVLVPVAMMHDIGHSAILPEHFKFITGSEKVANGKLVHMLVGAKIAHDILESVGYDQKKSKAIVDLISVHDADQIKEMDVSKIFDTVDKKFFHDIDSLDRYNDERIDNMKHLFKSKQQMISMLRDSLNTFFYQDFRNIAQEYIEKVENQQN